MTITPAGARTATGGVKLPGTAGTVAAAAFNIAGEANYTYTITLPSTDHVIATGGGAQMTVNNFVSSPATTGTLDGSGAQSLTVGATLNVSGGQANGVYTSGSGFSVTVNYN